HARTKGVARVVGSGRSRGGVGTSLVLDARRRDGGDGDQAESASKGDTHDKPLIVARFLSDSGGPQKRAHAGTAGYALDFCSRESSAACPRVSLGPPIIPPAAANQ